MPQRNPESATVQEKKKRKTIFIHFYFLKNELSNYLVAVVGRRTGV